MSGYTCDKGIYNTSVCGYVAIYGHTNSKCYTDITSIKVASYTKYGQIQNAAWLNGITTYPACFACLTTAALIPYLVIV